MDDGQSDWGRTSVTNFDTIMDEMSSAVPARTLRDSKSALRYSNQGKTPCTNS